MGHGNSSSADSGQPDPVDAGGGEPEEKPWWQTALQKGLAGAAATNSSQQGSPIAPIAPITTGIIDRIKARRAAKATPPIESSW